MKWNTTEIPTVAHMGTHMELLHTHTQPCKYIQKYAHTEREREIVLFNSYLAVAR